MRKKYIPGGYIMLSRKIIDSEIWNKPPLYLKVWIYILTKARHEETKEFERGELLISIPEIQEACTYRIGFRKETPSKKQIFTILEWLRNPYEGVHDGNDERNTKGTMIGTTKTTRGLIVKVHNYDVYQSSENYERNDEGNDEGQAKETMKGGRRERQGNTIHKNYKNKNYKNEKNVVVVSEDFKTVFNMYQENIELNPSPTTTTKLSDDLEIYGKEVMEYAIEKSALGNNHNYRFIDYLLKEWRRNQLTTVEAVKQYEDRKQSGIKSNDYRKNNQDCTNNFPDRQDLSFSNLTQKNAKLGFEGLTKEEQEALSSYY
ncbi:DnaD domain protein [Staphylococcus pseudintermedius]|nr:DnaD domain protein [Staphylococcus pseudintermedius]MCE5605717.1 DnaD domain protein [Staphylococcus pseudintermedius]MCE5607571.1 DnaD domain protein [Staphylococcus pseudintermedius]MCE5612624.1 DnaD domain protein [Staphylococcus pseudintermedius]MCE5706770.1 DnaD domain protein [Staphylococcus pseudintermedius]